MVEIFRALLIIANTFLVICNEESIINLDHQHLYFTSMSKTIAWRGHLQASCSTSNLESVKVTSFASCAGINRTTVEIWSTNMTALIIPTEKLVSGNSLLYFNITSLSVEGGVCQTLLMMFQVDPSVITEELYVNHSIPENVCTEVTSESSSFIYIVIPFSYDHTSDCTCPILILPKEQCFSFELCRCAADTHFINTLDICHNGTDHQIQKFQLCFSRNLHIQANNTVIHFYEQPPLLDCYIDEVYRKYIRALKIVIIRDNQESGINQNSFLTPTQSSTILSYKISALINSSTDIVGTPKLNPSNINKNFKYLNIVVIACTVFGVIATVGATTSLFVVAVIRKKKANNEIHIYEEPSIIIQENMIQMSPNKCYGNKQSILVDTTIMSPNPLYQRSQ